jgi:hypothetical protein
MVGLLILILIQAVIFGCFCAYIAGQKNRGKIEWFILGFLFSILAILALVSIPTLKAEEDADERSASKPEYQVPSVPEKRFAGVRNIAESNYQLFLAKEFGIEKSETLDKYVISDNVYDTLNDALKEADARYSQLLVTDQRREAEIEASKLKAGDAELVDAVWNGNFGVASKLLDGGIAPTVTDPDGKTLIELARLRRDNSMIQLLQSYGAT